MNVDDLLRAKARIDGYVELLCGQLGKQDRGSTDDKPEHTTPSLAMPLEELRMRLRSACDELSYCVAGPREHLMALAQTHRAEAALQYAHHFSLASLVPSDINQTISYSKIAQQAGVPVRNCARVFKLLMTYHIFREPEAGFVAHTETSLLLLDPGTQAFMGWWTDESFRAASNLAFAADKWQHSQKRNHSALNLVFDTTLPMFDYFSTVPWRAKRFAQTMTAVSQSGAFSLAHLVNGLDWAALDNGAQIVDIGGSSGHCSIAIADANTKPRFVVQDLKVSMGDAQVPQHLRGRIRYMEHDFFTPQPVQADIYLLRWILHDYPDEDAIRILQAQLPAVKAGAKIIIMDRVLPLAGKQDRITERNARIQDIGMWAVLNAGERDAEGWRHLFNQADPRLKLSSNVTPPGSALSIMVLELGET